VQRCAIGPAGLLLVASACLVRLAAEIALVLARARPIWRFLRG
jgi:hypothetical protein